MALTLELTDKIICEQQTEQTATSANSMLWLLSSSCDRVLQNLPVDRCIEMGDKTFEETKVHSLNAYSVVESSRAQKWSCTGCQSMYSYAEGLHHLLFLICFSLRPVHFPAPCYVVPCLVWSLHDITLESWLQGWYVTCLSLYLCLTSLFDLVFLTECWNVACISVPR